MPKCKFHPERDALCRLLCNACYRRLRRNGTVKEHTYKRGMPLAWLNAFIANVPDTDECIEWPFGRDKGYGVVFADGRCQRATRIVMQRLSGLSLDDMEACHSCDNPPCVNPRHLFAGTHFQNMTDAAAKGIMRKKLTAADVRRIRELGGTMLQREIAALFGINQTVVGDILRRTKWKHVA